VFSSGIFGRYLYAKAAKTEAADRIFRRWIVFHRPMAAIMYVLSAVHVVLSYMYSPGLAR
jgi:hypothetical protein